jgi:hypothetical protein
MGIFRWLLSGEGVEAPRWIRRWVLPRGEPEDDPETDQIKRAASEDVDEVERDRKYFLRDGPGEREDDL